MFKSEDQLATIVETAITEFRTKRRNVRDVEIIADHVKRVALVIADDEVEWHIDEIQSMIVSLENNNREFEGRNRYAFSFTRTYDDRYVGDLAHALRRDLIGLRFKLDAFADLLEMKLEARHAPAAPMYG